MWVCLSPSGLLTRCNVFQFYIFTFKFHFYFQLNSIPLRTCSTFSLCRRRTLRLFPFPNCWEYSRLTMVEQGSVEKDVEFFGHTPRNGITGLSSGVFLMFWELSHWLPQWLRQFAVAPTVNGISLSPHPNQHLPSVFLLLAILTGVRRNLKVVWISNSLFDKLVERFWKVFHEHF